jgi:hypothetical protein
MPGEGRSTTPRSVVRSLASTIISSHARRRHLVGVVGSFLVAQAAPGQDEQHRHQRRPPADRDGKVAAARGGEDADEVRIDGHLLTVEEVDGPRVARVVARKEAA